MSTTPDADNTKPDADSTQHDIDSVRSQSDPFNTHCSTFMLMLESGGPMLAHSEDWSHKLVRYLYFLDIQAAEEGAVAGVSARGFGYPAQVIGFALAANPSGLIFTQNSVKPDNLRVGRCVTFIGREIMMQSCIEDALAVLQKPGSAFGINVNMISVLESRGANTELNLLATEPAATSSPQPLEQRADVAWLSKETPYIPHFNAFMRCVGNSGEVGSCSSQARSQWDAREAQPVHKEGLMHR